MNKRLVFGVIAVVFVSVLVSAIVFRSSLSSFAQTVLGDVKPACESLPDAAVVNGREGEFKSLHDQVAQLTDGSGYVVFDKQRCPGRVELHIFYAGESDKPKLEELWRASSLRDVPVRWQNS